jgi:TRAP-type C4-dicarboxylate transport system substrate-binding protein
VPDRHRQQRHLEEDLARAPEGDRGAAKKLEPDFWAESLKADKDSLKRLTDGGMEVVQIPPAMMKDFQAKTAPLQEAFLKRVPASEKPVKAFLAEVKRSS